MKYNLTAAIRSNLINRYITLTSRNYYRCIQTINSIIPIYSILVARSSSFTTSSTQLHPSSDIIDLPVLQPYIQHTHDNLYIDQRLPTTYHTILIANRGEIACRIIRTCKQLNIRTVTVHSDIDANSQHVLMSDISYNIGGNAAADSYLNSERILEVAILSGAQAIHPGYGFLSENAAFASKCAENNIEFIGPPSSAIISMGSKAESKNIMLKAGVPCIPGYHGEQQSTQHLQQQADLVGYPLMIKAVSGGGGK